MSSKKNGKGSSSPRVVTKDNHYLIGGRQYDRVTSVCGAMGKPGLDKWRERVGEKEADRVVKATGEFGDKVHEILMYEDEGMDARVNAMVERFPYLIPYLMAWVNWTDKYVVEWLEIEKPLWSPSLMVAGRVDRIAIIKGDDFPSVVDIKTGNLYKEVGLQMAAYKLLYNESLGKGEKKAKRAIAVALPRKDPGELHVREYSGEKWEKEFVDLVKMVREMKL